MSVKWNDKIFTVDTASFEQTALDLFHFQYAGNQVYQEYIKQLGVNPANITQIKEIPFLPIRFFKSHKIVTGAFEPELLFESSGTTGMINSKHWVKEASLYEESFVACFTRFYGDISDWCIVGLLPSYLERQHSSLVQMVDTLIKMSGHADSGFYLYDFGALAETLQKLEQQKKKVLLIGVTFGLLDFAAYYSDQNGAALNYTTIMETGGMKGRRKEMVRDEVHTILKSAFGVGVIHSEYGMTELLSQGYSFGKGIFTLPAWMKVYLREEDDPLSVIEAEDKAKSGAINIIDMANVYSCAFIATEDLGKLYPDGNFEIIGRMDNSDIRGCSLMVV